MALFSNEVLTVDSDTVPEALDIPNGYPDGAMFSVEDGDIRITFNGDDPDNTIKNGLRIAAGTTFEITGRRDLQGFRVIKAGTDNASVSVIYQQKD